MDKGKNKTGLKEIVAYEKTQMLPLNFTVSYILTPIYAVICFLLIGAFAVLIESDNFYFYGELGSMNQFQTITLLNKETTIKRIYNLSQWINYIPFR